MVLPSGADSPQPKQVVIRNTTRQDIVLKIKSEAPRALQFEAEKIVVDSRKYVIVNMVFNEKELFSYPKGISSMVYVYARPVTKYNQENLRRWLTNENCESEHQLAFLIQLNVTSAEFSASKMVADKFSTKCIMFRLTLGDRSAEVIQQLLVKLSSREWLKNMPKHYFWLILDLPGHASLIDPISNAINANVDTDCVTGINIDADTNTANVLDEKDLKYALKIQQESNSSFMGRVPQLSALKERQRQIANAPDTADVEMPVSKAEVDKQEAHAKDLAAVQHTVNRPNAAIAAHKTNQQSGVSRTAGTTGSNQQTDVSRTGAKTSVSKPSQQSAGGHSKAKTGTRNASQKSGSSSARVRTGTAESGKGCAAMRGPTSSKSSKSSFLKTASRRKNSKAPVHSSRTKTSGSKSTISSQTKNEPVEDEPVKKSITEIIADKLHSAKEALKIIKDDTKENLKNLKNDTKENIKNLKEDLRRDLSSSNNAEQQCDI